MDAIENANANEVKHILSLTNRPFQEAKISGKVAFIPPPIVSNMQSMPCFHSETPTICPLNTSPLKVLQTVFGHKEFRPGQEEAISHLLSGKDTLIIIPTGGGKTVTYVLPCIMTPGIAIVVSPLIMLMYGQVTRLQGYGVNTCYFNTLLSENERQHILHNLKEPNCQYHFVYVSPEAVVTEQFQSSLAKLNNEKNLSFFIIDEAHCIDTWGKEFRPAYQKLGVLRQYNVPLAALTGTATTETLNTIKATLQMTDPQTVKMPSRRDNLIYSVIEKKENKAKQQIAEIIEGNHANECGLVYCATQADTVEMAFVLKEQAISATFYHAGIESGERMRNASLWLEGAAKVMCCTNAFGMGIDKSNVRFVIHLTFPSSLEGYAQQSGRGGRDGGNCSCILMFRFGDRMFHLQNISQIASDQVRENKLSLLNAMTHFCMDAAVCRARNIAKYFEEDQGNSCTLCDVCQKGIVHESKDYTEEAMNMMHCLTNLTALRSKIKVTDLVLTYMGSKAKAIISSGFDRVPQYGKGKINFKTASVLTQFVQLLIFRGYLKENVREMEERVSLTYLTLGNVTDLLNGNVGCFSELYLKCTYQKG
ncbi:uncharacterized protein LOC114531386 [Dendronephthya gigantea]|uniref:uncharacterized protein LOC114531386 n=1 Tax=Dendronephthya gigantea TaxID=151771 RepID=UPI00106B13F1|nr:uncharacterized protein LOC114531386 [Dendronephthya gigantea]